MKMLIDAPHAEETRVVVADGNKVEDFDYESLNKRQLAGNIYLAKVTRVEPSLQAAFVEYGGNRHGFLAFSEIHPDYYQIPVADREALLAEEAALNAAAEAEAEAETQPKSRRRTRAAKTTPADAVLAEEVPTEAASTLVEDLPENGSTAKRAPDGAAQSGEQPNQDASPSAEGPDADSTAPEGAGDAGALSGPAGDLEPVDGHGGPDEPSPSAANADPDAPKSTQDAPPAEASGASSASDSAQAGPDAETGQSAPADDVSRPAPEAASEGDAAQAAPDTAGAADPIEGEAEDEAAQSDASTDDDATVGAAEGATDPDADAPEDDHYDSVAAEDMKEEIAPRRARPKRYRIQEVIKVRQILLVQVVKEERGNKGAALTTYLSLAGRYCVLMPNTARGGGISRKITSATDRKKLKDIASEITVPQGAGLIIRTAGAKRTKSEIKRDYEFLLRQWEQIRDLTLRSIAPAPIYEEGSLIKRSIRDLYSREIDEIFVEGERGYREAKDYMRMLMPSHAKNVKLYDEPLPLFSRYQVESYLSAMFNPTVQLKSGGYIVIDVTEALVAVDVNSGRSTKEGSIEETALKTNLEAAEEVARQARLRDLAGLIVIDFIDMEDRRNNAAVEKRLKDKLKTDRARIQVGRISGFGLLEMSRQRLRPGMLEATTAPCPHCHGTGRVRSDDSLALAIMRELEEEGVRRRAKEVVVSCPVGIANYILNAKREHVAMIEGRFGLSVRVEGDPALISPEYKIERLKHATRILPKPEVIEGVVEALPELDEAEVEPEVEDAATEAEVDRVEVAGDEQPTKKKRRRRRRRKGSGSGDEAAEAEAQVAETKPTEAEAEAASDVDEKPKSRSRSRSRGRSRKSSTVEAGSDAAEDGTLVTVAAAAPNDDAAPVDAAAQSGGTETDDAAQQTNGVESHQAPPADQTAANPTGPAPTDAAAQQDIVSDPQNGGTAPGTGTVEAAPLTDYAEPDPLAAAVGSQSVAQAAASPDASDDVDAAPVPGAVASAPPPDAVARARPGRRGRGGRGTSTRSCCGDRRRCIRRHNTDPQRP